MPRARTDIHASLVRKGFIHYDGDHHYYVYHNLSGKKTIKKTKISRGSKYKNIDDSLLVQMARQIGLPKAKFLELVDCTLDQSGYEKIVWP